MDKFKTVHCEKCHAPILTAIKEKENYFRKHTVYCCDTEYHIRYKTNEQGALIIDRFDVIQMPNIETNPYQITEYPFEDNKIPGRLG